MYKRITYLVLMLLSGWMVLWNFPMDAMATENQGEESKKIIYVLYDNSYSTYEVSNNTIRNFWSEINYGVRAFYAMTGSEDEISIYKLVDKEPEEDEIEKSKGYSKMNRSFLDVLSNIKVADRSCKTYLDTVLYAIGKLDQEETRAEKWIIIFTDGQLEDDDGNKYTKEEIAKKINAKLSDCNDINACYIPISEEASNNQLDKNMVFQPKEKNDIAKQLLEVCNHIYKRRSIQKVIESGVSPVALSDGKLKISFDIPISKCILYAYSSETARGELEGEEILWQECIQPPDHTILPDNSLLESVGGRTGFIAELSTDPGKNSSNYNITFPEGISDINYEIYYAPAFSIMPQLIQNREDVLEGKYLAGNYEVAVAFSNAQTGEALSETASFLSVEDISVSIEENGQEQKLSKNAEDNRWKGSISPGSAVIAASTLENNGGEISVEFLKDYASAQLVTSMEDVYYMDWLGKKKQCIRLQVFLDGENITGEIQELLKKGERVSISHKLVKNGREYKNICFDREYDVVYDCWKLYPVFQGGIDYSLNGDYTFEAALKMEFDFYHYPVYLSTTQEDSFHIGIENKDISVDIEEPWKSKIRGLFFIWADKPEISFSWNGQKLPADVLEHIEIRGIKGDIVYQIAGQNKDEVKLKHKSRMGFFFQSDTVDKLQISGTAVLFGEPCEIFDDSILLQIQALNSFEKMAFKVAWLVSVIVLIVVIFLFVSYIRGYKSGERFWIAVKVYRSYENGGNRIRGTILRKIKWDAHKEFYIEYTLCSDLPKEFRMDKEQNKIKVRLHSRSRMEIVELKKPDGCQNVLLGDRQYSENSRYMSPDEKIQFKGEKSTVQIELENF